MKEFSIILIMLFTTQLSFSQVLVKENARWNVLKTNFFDYTMSTVSYKFEGDTIFNNETFKKLWASYDEDNEIWAIEDLLKETPDGKVFSQDNTLHYDFSLVAGDTVEHIEGIDCFYIVEQIDTIVLLDGSPRKRWAIRIPEPFPGTSGIITYWIEGIGSTFTLTDYAQATCATDAISELLCYHENEIVLYQNGDECFIINSTENTNKRSFEIHISPNPTTDYLNIYQYFKDAEIWQNGQYRILDSQGREVATFPVGQNDVTMVVPVWEWVKGVYFLQLVVDEGVVKTEKFVIQ